MKNFIPYIVLSLFFPVFTGYAAGDGQKEKIAQLLQQVDQLPEISDSVKILSEQGLALLKTHPDEILQASFYNLLARHYNAKGAQQKAMRLYLDALHLFKKNGDKRGEARMYNNIGHLHELLRDYPSAKECYTKSLRLKYALHDTTGLISTLNNIAGLEYENNEYDSAIFHYAFILDQFKSSIKLPVEAILTNNLGSCYMEIHKNTDALVYYKRTAKIYEDMNDEEGLALVYGNISKVETHLGHYDQAVEMGLKSLSLSREINSPELCVDAYSALRMALSEKGDYENAFRVVLAEMNLKDTVFNNETRNVVTEMRTKYETVEKEKENKLLSGKNEIQALQLSRDRYLIFGISVLIVVVIVISLLFVRQNRMRSVQRALEAEQKLLRTQMNPHFIFNSLTSIESFIYSNNPREAGRYLSDFARLMRLILENSREEEISLDNEIQTLEYYLGMQKLRMGDKLEWAVKTENIPDTSEILIPPMLAQPFIENAIEHGIFPSGKKGTVEVLFRIEKNVLHMSVTDNGMGIEQVSGVNRPAKKHKSLAMIITRERIDNYNRRRNNKIQFSVYDLSAEGRGESGTRAAFIIPLD